MLMIVAKLLKGLNSAASPSQIALAVAFAAVMGLTPLMSLHNLIVLFLVLVVCVNLTTFLVMLGVFAAAAYVLDPIFHTLGMKVLHAAALNELFNQLYSSTFWRLTQFNNTVLMGSLLFSIVLFVPLFVVSRWATIKYRDKFLAFVEKTKLIGFIKGTSLYSAYVSLAS